MTGAKNILDLRIILGTLIGIQDKKRNRRSRGSAFEYPGENLYFVIFVPGRRESGLPRLSPIQVWLYVSLRQLKPWRAAINDTANRRSVTFAEARYCEKPTDHISGHTPSRLTSPRYAITRSRHAASQKL